MGECSRPQDTEQGPEAGAPGRVSGIVGWRVRGGIRATALSPSKNFRPEVSWWPSSQRVTHCDLHLQGPPWICWGDGAGGTGEAVMGDDGSDQTGDGGDMTVVL